MMDVELQDIIWVLFCAFLVLQMQAGFLCLESGFVRSKNSINIAVKNLLDLCLVGIIFSLFGFGIMFGASYQGWMGTSLYFLSDLDNPWSQTFLFFQLVFCGTAVTIISGAVAERVPILGYLVIALLMSLIIYPVFGHWVWAGINHGNRVGWLAMLGFVDFAGSTVVHSVSAWVSLALLLIIGPRLGRFDSEISIQGHNPAISAVGVLLLWFGWFGFNGGSLLRVNEQIPGIMMNTLIAAMAGGLTGACLSWVQDKLVDARHVINGILAGLVSITAGCHAIEPAFAMLIGGVGGLICNFTSYWLVHLHIDDAVDAIPVHGFAGVWGTLSVGLFADLEQLGTGLTRSDQIIAQLTGIVVCFIWSFGIAFVLFFILSRIMRLRITPDQEKMGLNISEHGATTEIFELLSDMEYQSKDGDFSHPVQIEPHTEVGQIAAQYNQVLKRVVTESNKAETMTSEANRAKKNAEKAKQEMEEQVLELNEFNRLAIDRELRMIELKQEVNGLAQEQGKQLPYDLKFIQKAPHSND